MKPNKWRRVEASEIRKGDLVKVIHIDGGVIHESQGRVTKILESLFASNVVSLWNGDSLIAKITPTSAKYDSWFVRVKAEPEELLDMPEMGEFVD